MYWWGHYYEWWLVLLIAIPAAVVILTIIPLFVISLLCYKRYPNSKEKKNYAFFIPARNEENVIANVIRSIRAMDYPQDKVTIFILANNCSSDDNTAEIARDLGATVWEVQDNNINNVGLVLQRFFAEMMESGQIDDYDGFVRLDADNTVSKDYLSKLNDAFCVCPNVIATYRANQNLNDGIRTSFTGTLVGSMMMAFRLFSTWGINPIMSGPGMLIGRDVLYKLGGYNCTTISEDIELSAQLVKKRIRTELCYEAVFYDEQSSTIRMAWRQRLRWATGVGMVFNKYMPAMIKGMFVGNRNNRFSAFFMAIGLLPMGIIAVIATLTFFTIALVSYIQTGDSGSLYTWATITILLNTVPFYLVAILAYITERKGMRVSFFRAVLYILVAPFGFWLQTASDVARLFVKVVWKPIPHGQNKIKEV